MSKYSVTTGVQTAPVKTVLYGPEGIGKSTFASHFPDPVFIDTEGGTKRLNVARLPQPTSWAMLLDEVAEVRKGNVPCGTLVLDTADWAERLCIQAVCARAKVNGIEDFGYGKGYTYAKEEFAKLLDALEEVLNAGHNVVVLAHAAITKFEQPDAVVGQGDPVAVTQEERFPQQPFQLVDLLGDGRLRNEQFGRSFRKTEPVGDGLKDFQAEIGQHSFPRLKNRIGCCLRTGLLHPLAVQRRRRTIGHPHPDVIAHPGIAPVENHHFVL